MIRSNTRKGSILGQRMVLFTPGATYSFFFPRCATDEPRPNEKGDRAKGSSARLAIKLETQALLSSARGVRVFLYLYRASVLFSLCVRGSLPRFAVVVVLQR